MNKTIQQEAKPKVPENKPTAAAEAETILQPSPVGPDATVPKIEETPKDGAHEEDKNDQKESGDSADKPLLNVSQPATQPTSAPASKPHGGVVMRQKRGTKVFSGTIQLISLPRSSVNSRFAFNNIMS